MRLFSVESHESYKKILKKTNVSAQPETKKKYVLKTATDKQNKKYVLMINGHYSVIKLIKPIKMVNVSFVFNIGIQSQI